MRGKKSAEGRSAAGRQNGHSGFALRVCECGNIPVARGLLAKGVAPAPVITFLLAAPVFNLEAETVSTEEIVQVKIEFSRPMDHKATEEAFSIEPELKGEFSWAPRTLVYTSTRKPKPGVEYTVQVGESSAACGERSRAFSGTFTVRVPMGKIERRWVEPGRWIYCQQ